MRPGLEDTMEAPAAVADKPVDRPELPLDPPERTATFGASSATAASRDAATLATGQQLGHFRIERRLGAGGMGEVYLATDLALDRPVAVKVLPEAMGRDPRLRDRLIREARAQARVMHPNVGHIYFIGEEATRLFFAMEYVSGQTLAERVARGPMSVDDALATIRAAALGLREAQRHGFTHRDVKPSNLMVDAHGVVKVLDFGLAAGAPEAATPNCPVAQTSLAGTPLYMAPEQARGGAVDFRTDIYALGVTLFHLVSGKPPFNSDSIDELVTLHASAERPALPRRGQPRTQIGAIDALCTRMMAARPEDRFASYDDLLQAIEIASTSHTRPAGFWARTIATGLDFIVMTVLIQIALSIAKQLGAGDREEMPVIFLALLAYQALAVARWGRTLGKAVIELEVVDVATSTRPSLARATRRALVMLGIPTLALWVGMVLGQSNDLAGEIIGTALPIMAILVGFTLLFHASIRITGKRPVWDRAAGTMVRYRTTRPTGAL